LDTLGAIFTPVEHVAAWFQWRWVGLVIAAFLVIPASGLPLALAEAISDKLDLESPDRNVAKAGFRAAIVLMAGGVLAYAVVLHLYIYVQLAMILWKAVF
jgi:hypothetical protein